MLINRGKSRVLVAVPFFFGEDEVLIDWIGARSVFCVLSASNLSEVVQSPFSFDASIYRISY